MKDVSEAFNTLSEFLALRDLDVLSKERLLKTYGIEQVDLIILFGGTIPHGYDVAAQAYLDGLAKRLMIVGGVGHTTEAVRTSIHERYPNIWTENAVEAEMIANYLGLKYGISDCILETQSSNCGNNVSFTLSKLRTLNLLPTSVIIMQDATMQHRMKATFEKLWDDGLLLINYVTYEQQLMVVNNELRYRHPDLWGMWQLEHYISLLLGEIERLHDDEFGYGPNGKKYIAHVDIPDDVSRAFEYLKVHYPNQVRQALDQYK